MPQVVLQASGFHVALPLVDFTDQNTVALLLPSQQSQSIELLNIEM